MGSLSRPLTLAAFVENVWAPRARRRLAPKTWERDSIVYERHVRPALGDLPIAAIDVEDLAEWQDGLEEAGVGSPTVIKAMSIVSSVFREAARPRGARAPPASAAIPLPCSRSRERGGAGGRLSGGPSSSSACVSSS